MSQEVVLSVNHTDPECILTTTVYVEKAVLSDVHVRLEGLDPSKYPDPIRDELTFYSKNMTAVIEPESAVTVESVSPSTEPVPSVQQN